MTSSARMAQLASKAMKITKHGQLTLEEIRELGASVESQRQDDPATRHPKKTMRDIYKKPKRP
jgi:hypothetical protein